MGVHERFKFLCLEKSAEGLKVAQTRYWT